LIVLRWRWLEERIAIEVAGLCPLEEIIEKLAAHTGNTRGTAAFSITADAHRPPSWWNGERRKA
jgi:hypothetical protein